MYHEPTIASTEIKTTSNSSNIYTTESSSSWVMAVIGAVCAVVVLTAIGLITWCVIRRRRKRKGQREPKEQHPGSQSDPTKGTVVPFAPTAEEQPVAEPHFQEFPEAQVVYVLPAPAAPSALVTVPPLSEPHVQELPEAQAVYIIPAPGAPSAPDCYSKHNIGP